MHLAGHARKLAARVLAAERLDDPKRALEQLKHVALLAHDRAALGERKLTRKAAEAYEQVGRLLALVSQHAPALVKCGDGLIGKRTVE